MAILPLGAPARLSPTGDPEIIRESANCRTDVGLRRHPATLACKIRAASIA